jgi:hypothetical protein
MEFHISALGACFVPARRRDSMLQLLFLLPTLLLADNGAKFNVRDFGAAGDGVTDDTAAIQLALDTAANATLAFMHVGAVDHAVVASRATVLFPRGVYVLSDTLRLNAARTRIPGYHEAPDLLGEARSVLHMTRNDTDLLYGDQVVRWRVAGLSFVGGANQLHVGNNNTDKGQILVDDCSFLFASGAAIRLLAPSDDAWPDRVGQSRQEGRGTGGTGGGVSGARHGLRAFGGSFSTHVAVQRSVFEECAQALVNFADWTTVDNVWVTTSPTMRNDSAVFENHDRLFLSNVLGVPRDVGGAAARQRWVDNYAYRYDGGRVSMRGFRFGGEGAGMAAIYNFAPLACELVPSPYSHMDLCGRVPHGAPALPPNVSLVPGAAITLTGSQLDTHQPIVYAAELPAHVTVAENELRDGTAPGIPVLDTSALNLSAPLFAALFARASAGAAPGQARRWLSYNVDDASNWNGPTAAGGALPQQLWPYAPPATKFRAERAPEVGAWRAGAVVLAEPPSLARYGWLCTAAGSPGTWEAFGLGGGALLLS